MPQSEREDLNVMNLTETKSRRAPTSESLPVPEDRQMTKWAAAGFVAALGGLVAVFVISARMKSKTAR
jgi:hypothetical protein